MLHHREPLCSTVVGTVDACHVHARSHHVVHQCAVQGGLARQSHHDANPALLRCGAEQGRSVLLEQLRPGVKAGGFILLQWCPFPPDEAVQDPQYLVQVGQHMRFRPAQRRQAQSGQPGLDGAHVELPQGQIVGQIGSTQPLRRSHGRGPGTQSLGVGAHDRAQAPEFFDQVVNVGQVPERGGSIGQGGFHDDPIKPPACGTTVTPG
jgi:hypothetical protein